MKQPTGDTVYFTVPAKPVSLQGSSASKTKLKALVEKQISNCEFLLTGEIEVIITLRVHERERYEGLFSPDVDNILKPLLDAMCGPTGIMVNDCQVQSVRCSWIDWVRTDHSLLFEIRHDPEAWIPKENVVWVEIADRLCMPLNTGLKPEFQEKMLSVWKEMFSARKAFLEEGVDYYDASSVLPVQRPFYRPRLQGFKVINLKTAEKRIAALKKGKNGK